MDDYQEKFKELLPLQQVQTRMLCYIDEFCRENGIEWCLAYGSALGARRHGGPIPWDDDTDIYMTADGYEKFRRLFREKGDQEHFYLQERESVDGKVFCSKLRMNGTTFLEDVYKGLDMHQGIFVDIFILHEAPPTALEEKKSIAATCYLILKSLSNRGYKKRKLVVPLMAALRLFPKSMGFRSALNQLYKWDSVPQSRWADWQLYTGTPRWFLPKEYMFPAARLPYNGHSFCVPREVEKYLEICYGSWQEIPSIDKIQWAQHMSYWDAQKDFREFLPNIHDFKDERF